MPTLKDLAEVLHEKLCPFDHVEQCTWLYENDRDQPWSEWGHRHYFEKAHQLSTKTDLPTETLIKVVSNL